ncbi:MAG: energy-coupling factor ABC transporter ATP-binding protein [Chloroflexota bacterium]|nr:energy-coupling factor ABC transporter ATP-binding protein [Chloroflexota bacterium]
MEALTFRYRRALEPAIRDLSLRVHGGEVLLVAGPSGCGKSTLIRAMNGLIPHAYRGDLRGAVRVDGRSTGDLRLRDISLVVGTMLQDPARQIVGSTVAAELAFGPENLGQPPAQIRERIGQVIAQAGIEALAGRDTASLSGGERQLVAMAGTLMLRPRVYVVDEPLANLDPATARRLLLTLRALADEGHAVVIVEHRVEEALALRPDRVLYLDEGVARYLGPVDGFLRMADPEAVRLPFEVVLERARTADAREPAPPARPRGPTAPVRLAFEGVTVALGGREVIRGLTASLGARQVVAVLGPNGSGKTTMFRAAMRLIHPAAGSINVDGRPAAERTVAELARVFGYVFQSPSQMLFARTVREELLFGPRNLGLAMDDADETARESLRRASLDEEGILDRPPLTLSFGQQKRLALAIGLALHPRTLILDEPSAGQDHRSATQFMEAVEAISELESLYFVTHDVDLALAHADRILVIRDGEVVADGPPEDVITDEERWRSCNLYRTSLMAANLAYRPPGSRFLDATALAQLVVASESERGHRAEGGSPTREA